jgi:predicted RNA-binding Zn-ribbon protein involved in translation (DUF1610 family)
MRRLALYGGAAVVLVSALVTLFRLTSSGRQPLCPQCGASILPAETRKEATGTTYRCRQCLHWWRGPARYDFSWAAAIEEFVSGDKPIE